MGSSQMRRLGRNRRLCSVFVCVTALVFPAVCIGQYKKNPPPPPQRSAPAPRPAVREQRQPPAPAAPRPNPGSYPTYRPAPNQPAAAPNVGRTPVTPSYAPGNNTAFHPGTTGQPAVAPSGVRNSGVPSFRPGNSNSRTNGVPGGGPAQQAHSVTTMNLKSGGTAQLGTNGQFRSIDRGGAHIAYGAHGVRTVVAQRNGALVVASGTHHGYVQRPYVTRNGHAYVQRTYVMNNVTRTVAYRSYSFRGANYYAYAPAYYYRPAYYRWAYTPWRSPVYWSWGWTPAAYPWYGYYGSYFSPAPAYPSAAYWLTDYVVAADLQAAYAARSQAAPAALIGDPGAAQADDSQSAIDQPPAPLGPDVKQAISLEVAEQLEKQQRNAAQTQPPSVATTETMPARVDEAPPALDPNYRTFVVSGSLDVASVDQECTLTPGDVITRLTDTPDKDGNVTAKVWTSKKQDCVAGRQITVAVGALQDMQNHLNQQLDSGLQQLANLQGTGGLPKAPDASLVAGEVPPPVADASAAQTLEAQEAAADQAEKETAMEVAGQGVS